MIVDHVIIIQKSHDNHKENNQHHVDIELANGNGKIWKK
jgi:hypothetical protein